MSPNGTSLTRRQFLLGVGSSLLLVACAGPNSASPSRSRTVEKISVALAPPRSVNQAMPYLGRDKGFYRDQGIEPDFQEIDASPTAIRALASKQVDLLDTSAASVTVAVASGAPLKHVGAISKGLHIAIFVKREINSLADLYGRGVAVTGVGTLPHTVLLTLMRQQQLDPAKVNILPIGTQNTFLSLLAGKVDANVSSIDDLPEAQQHPEVKLLVTAGEKLPNFVRMSIATRDDVLVQRQDVLVRFLTAYLQSFRYSIEHKDEIVDLSTTLNQRERSTNAQIFDAYHDKHLLNMDMSLTAADLDYIQDVGLLTGSQKTKVPTERLLNTDIQEKMVSILGPYKEPR